MTRIDIIGKVTRANEGDAGADLYSQETIELAPLGRAKFPTGVHVAIPKGMVGYVNPRSGLAANYGVTVLNAPGVIDSGFRGELKVTLVNLSPDTVTVNAGDRIAQLVIHRYEMVEFHQVDELEDSSDGRGINGFGSSGR